MLRSAGPGQRETVGFIILNILRLCFSSKLFSFPSVEGLIMVVFTLDSQAGVAGSPVISGDV